MNTQILRPQASCKSSLRKLTTSGKSFHICCVWSTSLPHFEEEEEEEHSDQRISPLRGWHDCMRWKTARQAGNATQAILQQASRCSELGPGRHGGPVTTSSRDVEGRHQQRRSGQSRGGAPFPLLRNGSAL